MPSVQRGSVVKRGKRWGARFYDENGARRFQGGFETKTVARDWLDNKVKEVTLLRRGDLFVVARDRPQTVEALLDLFLARHGRTIDAATERKLRSQLKHARKSFGDRHPDGLHKVELEDWREQLPPGSRHDVFRAFRQALAWAVDRQLATVNASNGIKTRSGNGTNGGKSIRSSRGRTLRQAPTSSTSVTGRSRSWLSAAACDRRSCSPSSAVTSIGTRTFCTFGGASPEAY